MSEHSELKADPLAEQLGRFTPDTTGFDRDALLFQAGQASVRPGRLWPALAGLFAVSQAATLLFFLTRSPEMKSPDVVVTPRVEPSKVEENPMPSPESEAAREWSYRRPVMTGDIDDLPKPQLFDDLAVPDKVLTVQSFSSVLSVD